MNKTREVSFLFVVFGFPPRAGSGVQRAVRYLQLLPEQGWEPLVLTVSRWGNDIVDEEWEKRIPNGIKIYRAFSLDPFRIIRVFTKKNPKKNDKIAPKKKGKTKPNKLHLFRKFFDGISVPDHAIWWLPWALILGLYIIFRHRPKHIFSTSGPYGTAVAGLVLKKLSGLPWVAEFRDPWVENPMRNLGKLRKFVETRLEYYCLKNADGIISVSEPLTEHFRLRTPNTLNKKYLTITNGFQIADFAQFPDRTKNGFFHLVYTGMFYGHHTPMNFFSALQDACKKNPVFGEKVRVTMVGTLPEESLEILKEEPWREIVRFQPYLPHSDIYRILAQADALLLILAKEMKDFYSSKLFEYLAARRYIIAIVPPDGIAADLIRRFEAGTVASADDVDAIASALLEVFQQFKSGKLKVRHSLTDLSEFSWVELCAKLAGFFRDIVKET